MPTVSDYRTPTTTSFPTTGVPTKQTTTTAKKASAKKVTTTTVMPKQVDYTDSVSGDVLTVIPSKQQKAGWDILDRTTGDVIETFSTSADANSYAKKITSPAS